MRTWAGLSNILRLFTHLQNGHTNTCSAFFTGGGQSDVRKHKAAEHCKTRQGSTNVRVARAPGSSVLCGGTCLRGCPVALPKRVWQGPWLQQTGQCGRRAGGLLPPGSGVGSLGGDPPTWMRQLLLIGSESATQTDEVSIATFLPP